MNRRAWLDRPLLALSLAACLAWLVLCLLMFPILVVSNWLRKTIG